MNQVYLLTGGNVGDRKSNLKTASVQIEDHIGEIINRSSVYETEAWGNTDQPAFYNQVLLAETPYPAADVLEKIFAIESRMGRIRTTKNASRIIDIDILFFNDDLIDTENITVPHPEIQNRKFVLMPLMEIAPEYVHSRLHKTVSQLLQECTDPLKVSRLDFK